MDYSKKTELRIMSHNIWCGPVYNRDLHMRDIYMRLLDDLLNDNRESPIFTHHIDYINKSYYKRVVPYEDSEPNQIVVDYIAGMTDNYFIELHRHLFPESDYKVEYKGYFD